jgi:hypothetical protein
MAAQRRMAAFRIHGRVALAAVERQARVVIYRKAKVYRQHNSPDLRLHIVARCGGGRYERSTESRQRLLLRPVVGERI